MKQRISALFIFCLPVLTLNAQTRHIVYEEFSGEHCFPCANQSADLWSLLQTGSNPSKILMVKYMNPSYAFFMNQNAGGVENRFSYYAITSWPATRMDGGPQDPANPWNVAPMALTQTLIDNRYAVPSAFVLSVSSYWNASYDSVTSVVSITAASNFAPVGASMHLRCALLETLQFDSPPGTNGEKHLDNIVRNMYPDANGTAISNSWTAGTSQTITLKGSVPAYVDRSAAPFVAVWIQNDNDKQVEQAAWSAPLPAPSSDVGVTLPKALHCGPGGCSPTVSIVNTGTSMLTSATLHYSVNGGPLSALPWSGSLAPGGSTAISLPSMPEGDYSLYDSVSVPNGATDVNLANNTKSTTINVRSSSSALLPVTCDFESSLSPGWALYNECASNYNWRVVYVYNHSGTGAKAAVHGPWDLNFYDCNSILVPSSNISDPKTLYFWLAYGNSDDDTLEVQYTVDCGASWVPLWRRHHGELQSTVTEMDGSTFFVPAPSEWRLFMVDVSHVPSGAQLAIRAISDKHTNQMYIDDIGLTNGAVPTHVINSPIAKTEVSVFPLPAIDMMHVSVSMPMGCNARLVLSDIAGREVYGRDNELRAGVNLLEIPVKNVAAGLYLLELQTPGNREIRKIEVEH